MAGEGQVIRFSEKQALFQQGLKKVYHNTLRTLKSSYQDWLTETTMAEWYTTVMGHSGLGIMQEKQVGATISRDRLYYGAPRTFTGKAYALALAVQYEVIRWDLYDVFQPVTKELARTAVQRYDLVAYGLPNNAFSTSNSVYTDYNGEAFCATSHTRMDGGTWKNRPTTDVGLSMTAIQTATTDLKKTVNDRGMYLADMKPAKLMVAVENEWLANVLTKSQYNPDNANQQYNNVGAYNLSSHVSQYITNANYWFLIVDKTMAKIAMAKGDDPDLLKDSEPNTRNMLFNSYCSFRMEVYEGRGWYGSTGG
jgi:hypothetical protein